MLNTTSSSQPREKNRFRRVIFVGAGFSAGMCYPVGNTLTQRIIEYLQGARQVPGISEKDFKNSLNSKKFRHKREEIGKVIIDFLKKYFGVSGRSFKEVKVAEFFTMAHTLAETPSMFGFDEEDSFDDLTQDGPIHERHLFKVLACISRTYFIDICQSVERPEDIEDFLDSVDPERDAIINFNWDEEVDIYLAGDPNGKGEAAYTRDAWRPPDEKEERYLLLRPHGSIGWYDITCGIGNKWTYLIAEEDRRIHRSQKRIVAYNAIGWPIDLATGKPFFKLACPPIITPPTFAKRFQYKEQQQIWSDILEICSGAREFVFLGYSLPTDDYLTRAAIRSSLATPQSESARCLVVGLNPETLENFRSIFGNCLTSDRHFLRWKFGCNKVGLAERIESKLKGAVVASEKST